MLRGFQGGRVIGQELPDRLSQGCQAFGRQRGGQSIAGQFHSQPLFQQRVLCALPFCLCLVQRLLALVQLLTPLPQRPLLELQGLPAAAPDVGDGLALALRPLTPTLFFEFPTLDLVQQCRLALAQGGVEPFEVGAQTAQLLPLGVYLLLGFDAVAQLFLEHLGVGACRLQLAALLIERLLLRPLFRFPGAARPLQFRRTLGQLFLLFAQP